MAMAHLIDVIWCRSFQAALKLGNCFLKYPTPLCLEGPGKIRELGPFLREQGLREVLVVTGSGMVRRGQVQPMLESFHRSGIRCEVLAFDHPDPTSEDVALGYQTYRDKGCKAIVALGGGSRIDCAKAIAAKAVRPKKEVAQLQGLLKIRKPIPPLIAVPTTAGAGSETTVAAVITDAATHRKAAINDPVLVPKYAVLDPQLTTDLPPYITATTGMDALAHAVEAYTNHTYNTKLEDALAKEAVRRIHGSILTAFADGQNLQARRNMQRAAFCAGRAFTRGCVGYVHAIGHTLGGLYGVAHGLAMAVLLPVVMEEFGAAVHRPLAQLADECGIEGASDGEKAENFLRWIRQTNEAMGLPDSFDMIREEDIPQMIAWARKEANPLYPVPVIWGEDTFRRVIQKIRR